MNLSGMSFKRLCASLMKDSLQVRALSGEDVQVAEDRNSRRAGRQSVFPSSRSDDTDE